MAACGRNVQFGVEATSAKIGRVFPTAADHCTVGNRFFKPLRTKLPSFSSGLGQQARRAPLCKA